MGIYRTNGYSATVEGFLVIGESRFRLAKTNGVDLVLSDACELPPNTTAEMVIIIDGLKDSKRIVLPQGVTAGQVRVPYEVANPG